MEFIPQKTFRSLLLLWLIIIIIIDCHRPIPCLANPVFFICGKVKCMFLTG